MISRGFDEEGALAEVVDGEGRRWRYVYGAFDVLQEIVDPKGGRLRLAYDSEGRLIEVINALHGSYRMERDVAGRIVREVDFDDRETHYARDKVGRVVAKTKPDGARLTYAYDKSGLVTAIQSFGPKGAAEDAVSFAYDRRGLLIEAKNKAARVEYTRDRNGRVTEEDINARRVKSRYDACGRRVERRIFTGLDRPEATRLGEHLARFEFDPLGAVAKIALGDHAPLAFYRDTMGRETQRQSPAGFTLRQDYDPVGQLREQAFGARGSSPHRRRFAFDRAGSPVGIDDTIWGASAYSQDVNGQTVEASHGVARGVETGAERWYRGEGGAEEIERFAYDSAHNIFASGGGEAWLTSVGGVVSAARGPQGERIALTHDSCGRVVERRVERAGFRPKHWAYQWDAFDRLVACETPEGARWTYAYDPFGRRIEKRGPRGAGSLFTWDGDVPVEDSPLDADGKPDYAARTDWHFLPGSFSPLAKVSGGRLSYVVADHLGTPRELLTEKGELEWAASYRLWGSMRALRAKRRVNGGVEPDPDDAEVCPFRFPGQWADEETGLFYNRHRHYDPLVGQYASPDPIGLEGGDRPQGYVARPGCWVDPLGLNVNLASPQRTAHILDGDATGGGHAFPGASGKSSFPANWSREKIMHEISDIATDPLLVRRRADGKTDLFYKSGKPARFLVQGMRDGVDITVVVEPAGEGIITGYPTK